MKLRSRTLAVIVGAALAAGTLTACSAGSESGVTTISYYSWWNQKSVQPMVDEFEKENPKIKIDLSAAQGASADYTQTLTTRMSGGQEPDVFHLSTDTFKQLTDGGYVRDITNEPFMKSIDPAAKSLYTKDGKVYGMSPTAWAGAIIYNKDLLKKAGYSSVPTTFDEFLTMGKKLKSMGVTPYMEAPASASGSFQPMLGGYYAKQGDEENDTAIYDGKTTFSEAWTPLLKQWNELVTSGVLPKDVVGVNADQIKQEFMTGQLAMYRSGPWDFTDLDSSGVKYSAAPFPALKGGEPFIGGGPDSPYAISSKISGAKLKAAEKFLAFANSAEGLKIASKNLQVISTSSEYDTKVPAQLKEVYTDYLKPGKYYWLNFPAGATTMSQEMIAEWQLLIQGKATPAEVTAALDQKWATVKK